MQISFTSLIISPDAHARIRLKEALLQILVQSTIHHAKDTREGRDIIFRDRDVAAIFVHSIICSEEIYELYKKIRVSNLRYKPILVVTLHTDHNLSDLISDHFLNGIEGFLQEPFTTEEVAGIIDLTLENRKTQIRQEEKELSAIQFMLKEGIDLVDQAALERSRSEGRGGGFAIRRLKRLRMRVRTLEKKVSEDQLAPILEKIVAEQSAQLDLSQFKRRETQIVFAEHPGSILGAMMRERKLSAERLTELLTVDKNVLDRLLALSGPLTPELSKDLARVIGKTEDYWLSLQLAYEKYENSKQS
ncbi:MAG: hypothetical protein KDD62_05840 [Bdellovibrionales bacterium]|nr:hypothetical protein [Bdellovibrionales bacterium]